MSGNFPPAGRTPGRHRRPRARVIFVLNANQFVVTLTPSNMERRRRDERVARHFLSPPGALESFVNPIIVTIIISYRYFSALSIRFLNIFFFFFQFSDIRHEWK